MKENPYSQDKEEIRELLKQFQNLKAGRSHSFLDEDAFEKIIDYFDDAEDLSRHSRQWNWALSSIPIPPCCM